MSLERRGLHSPSSAFNPIGRDTGRAAFQLTNGAEVQGTVLLPSGGDILELLNLPGGPYIAVTDARVSSAIGTRTFSFIAVNKAHIVSAREIVDETSDPEGQ